MIPHWKQKFVLLWTGQALSILSSMVSQYALIWYLTDLTGSPAVLSLATMAAMVPQGVLSLFTGAFADRFDRRIIMMVSDGAIGLISLALAALAFAGPLPVAPILAVAALRSVGGAFHAPCIQAVTPLIAPPESLTRCAGWSQGIQTVSMLLSPALASVLYAHVPLAWILLLDTLGAVFAIGGVLLARLPVLRAGAHGAPLRLWQDTREGLALGELAGPNPAGAPWGHGHDGWAIWGGCFLLSLAMGGVLERLSRRGLAVKSRAFLLWCALFVLGMAAVVLLVKWGTPVPTGS